MKVCINSYKPAYPTKFLLTRNWESTLATYLSESFTRPDQRVLHPAHDAPVQSERVSVDIEMFYELFQNCFQGHVEPHLSAFGDKVIPTKDQAKKRGIQNDLLTAYFQVSVYEPATISASTSLMAPDLSRTTINSFIEFQSKVTASPISDEFQRTGNPGSNRFNFLSGEIGCGKSLLLAKLTTDIHRAAESKLATADNTGEVLIPIHVDFELLLDKVGDRFRNVKEAFTPSILSAAKRQIARYKGLQDCLKSSQESLPPESQFRELCVKLLSRTKAPPVRLLIVLDNVDRYHFYHTKFCFFDNYRREHISLIKQNLDQILNTLCDNEFLGDCGMCVVLACRPATLTAFSHHNSVLHGNSSKLKDFGVFQIARPEYWSLIESRLQLLDDAVAAFKNQEPRKYADFKSYAATIRNVLSKSFNPEDPDLHGNSLKLISDFAHQGPRSFLSFLSDLKIDWRMDTDVVPRIFGARAAVMSPILGGGQPRNLVRLYIANNRQRFAQNSGHFPNLFLVDATYAHDSSVPDSEVIHSHTYW